MDFHQVQVLVDYHYWGRDRLLAAIRPVAHEQLRRRIVSSFSSIHETVVHLYGADWVWCSRWEGATPATLPDPAAFPDVASIASAWAEQEQRIRGFVGRLGPGGVLEPIEYERAGVRQAQPFWQLLQHLVNHGSYHRGQVTTMLRQIGAEPPQSMDLITFYREHPFAHAG